MDPKEYLPYLEKLRGIQDEVERRYTINIDLKNFLGAAEALSKVTTTLSLTISILRATKTRSRGRWSCW